jgi:hypothetical protein
MLCASLQVNLSADTAQLQQRKSYMYMYQKVNGVRLMCSLCCLSNAPNLSVINRVHAALLFQP